MVFRSGDSGTQDGITGLTADRAVITNGSGGLASSVTTALEISYVSGATSNIQAQINALQPAGAYITALTGDVTATGPGSVPATLATVNASPGAFGSAASTLTATVNGKGLVTVMTAVAISIPFSQVTGTLAFSNITGTVPINQGGTGQTTANTGYNALSPMTTNGDIEMRAAGIAARLGVGSTGQVLTVAAGLPSWATPTPAPPIFTSSLIRSVTSSTKTPGGSGQYYAMGGSPGITFAAGDVGRIFRLFGTVNFNISGSPVYTTAGVGFFEANGGDSGSVPTSLGASIVTLLNNFATQGGLSSYDQIAGNGGVIQAAETYIQVASTGTIFMVPFATMGTPGSARITTFFNAVQMTV